MRHSIIASAPGRVCLAGEDIDWISGPAILGAIGLRIRVSVKSLSRNVDFVELTSGDPFNLKRRVLLRSIGQYEGHPLDCLQAAIRVLSKWGITPTPVRIDVDSDLPARVGLASSAAVAVASVAALSRFYELELSLSEIC